LAPGVRGCRRFVRELFQRGLNGSLLVRIYAKDGFKLSGHRFQQLGAVRFRSGKGQLMAENLLARGVIKPECRNKTQARCLFACRQKRMANDIERRLVVRLKNAAVAPGIIIVARARIAAVFLGIPRKLLA
jgi:hypothetical protein